MLWYLIGFPLLALLTGSFAILPTPESLPDGIDEAFTGIAEQIGKLSNIIDLTPYIEVLGLMLVVLGFTLTWLFFNWILNKLRGSG